MDRSDPPHGEGHRSSACSGDVTDMVRQTCRRIVDALEREYSPELYLLFIRNLGRTAKKWEHVTVDPLRRQVR